TQHQPAVHPFGLLGTITQKIVNRFLVGRLRTVVWWRWAEPEDALTQVIDPKAFRVFQLILL
ncbi:hypothetical protein, partial [Xanthomonas campestris]|uniref:hypothetical protein n=1 Tax=Xanthomonas campestris TaxID=339 RepID=UPI002B223DA0